MGSCLQDMNLSKNIWYVSFEASRGLHQIWWSCLTWNLSSYMASSWIISCTSWVETTVKKTRGNHNISRSYINFNHPIHVHTVRRFLLVGVETWQSRALTLIITSIQLENLAWKNIPMMAIMAKRPFANSALSLVFFTSGSSDVMSFHPKSPAKAAVPGDWSWETFAEGHVCRDLSPACCWHFGELLQVHWEHLQTSSRQMETRSQGISQ